MPVSIEREKSGEILLNFGGENSIWFPEAELEALGSAIFYWQYETQKRGRAIESIVVEDDGVVTVTPKKGK